MKTAVGEVQGEALTLVNTTNTAIAAESGSLPVLGTPFMLALMEKATCEAVGWTWPRRRRWQTCWRTMRPPWARP